MTHARNPRHAATMLAMTIATSLVIAPGVTVAPASARTFDLNSAGSMVQPPLPSQWACAMRRALSDREFPCRGSSVLNATAIGGSRVASQRRRQAAMASRRLHRASTR
jgi:hypothetical protein